MLKEEPTTAKLPVFLLGGYLRSDNLKQIAAETDKVFAIPLALTEVREAVKRLLKPEAGTDPTHP